MSIQAFVACCEVNLTDAPGSQWIYSTLAIGQWSPLYVSIRWHESWQI